MRGLRRRFWVETAGSAVSLVAFVVTLIWPDWIERVFGVDPDGGNGSFEWLIVALLLLATVAGSVVARREWARPRRLWRVDGEPSGTTAGS